MATTYLKTELCYSTFDIAPYLFLSIQVQGPFFQRHAVFINNASRGPMCGSQGKEGKILASG